MDKWSNRSCETHKFRHQRGKTQKDGLFPDTQSEQKNDEIWACHITSLGLRQELQAESTKKYCLEP